MQNIARQNPTVKLLLLALGVLIVALIVVLILMLSGGAMTEEEREINLLETGRFLDGVSVGGVDISGLLYSEALASQELNKLSKDFADDFTYTLTVAETEYTFAAHELGLKGNLEQVLQKAMFFGQVGEDKEVINQQREQAQTQGVNFELGVYGEEQDIKASLISLKPLIDSLAADATFDIIDDLKGDPNAVYLADLEGVTLIEDVVGADVRADELARMIYENISKGDYSVIDAPVLLSYPELDAQTLMSTTQKISEFTTEFKGRTLGHPNRVNNIRIFANIINGTILKTGVPWSLNEAAGPRNSQTAKTVGWLEAPGISSGRYEDMLGGGVCQVSSTIYNAAIRSEMEIVQRKAHSWPSSYVPEGMDATISTGGPDLVIANPYAHPVYMVAYLDEEAFTLTVEFYGPPLEYIIEFTTERVGTTKPSPPVYHYSAVALPDGTPIAEGKTETWISPRDGSTWRVYKHYKDNNGNTVKQSERFSQDTYRAFQGVYYVNGPDPATVVVIPDESGGDTE